MPVLKIITDGDNCWPDLQGKDYENGMGEGTVISVALLKGGMTSGKSSVSFRVDLPGGKTVLFETSLDLFVAAAKALEAADKR